MQRGGRSKRKVVCCSCIHHQSIDQFRDGTAGTQAVGGLKAGRPRQSEVAVDTEPAVAGTGGLPMRCE